MKYEGIIVTGTSCAGKTTVAKELCSNFAEFQIVKAITTRTVRTGDLIYDHITGEQFDAFETNNELLVKANYRGKKYGISKDTYNSVIRNSKIPVLIITPESAKDLEIEGANRRGYLIFFLDAKDASLDARLAQRQTPLGSAETTQREADRRFREYTKDSEYLLKNTYVVFNNDGVDISDIINLIFYLWGCRGSGGMIAKKMIESMIECGMLLENAKLKLTQGASYDLRLGAEYFQNAEIKHLDATSPFIIMNPGDYVIASSIEIANLPTDIAGRFDLTVSLFCKGIILSNGPQVDPGFKGRLFCLLFNTSNEIVELKYEEHFATIEFIKLTAHTTPYYDRYQGKSELKDYIKSMVKKSAISKLIEDVKGLKREKWFTKYLPLLISILCIIVSILALILGITKSGNPSNP